MSKKRSRFILPYILKFIERTDDQEIQDVIQAVIRRYALAFPDWEVMFLSLPKDPQKREAQLELTIDFLRKHT